MDSFIDYLRGWADWLQLIGLLLSMLGALFFCFENWLSRRKALSEKEEADVLKNGMTEDLQEPLFKDGSFVTKRAAFEYRETAFIWGFQLLFFGFAFQVLALALTGNFLLSNAQ